MRLRQQPQVGDTVLVVQSFRNDDVDEFADPDTADVVRTNKFEATVHYVRKRGDYQIEVESGRRYWVSARHVVRDGSIAGTAWVEVAL